MMDWTDRHCRAFHRVLTRAARLYTEMLTADALIHGDRARLLGFSPIEHPIALQLGGSDPGKLALAARIGADWGYDEINLNVGCPSDRVQEGRFGACLMREPELVARCVAAMAQAVHLPVTVKCRIGVDDQDPEAALFTLVEQAARAGCNVFIVHARKAWLQGLNPKENREIPPLDYALVRRLKALRPDLTIVLNGGLTSIAQAKAEGMGLDGVMLGRAAYQTPRMLLEVDSWLMGQAAPASGPIEAVRAHRPYVEAALAAGLPLHRLTRAMLGVFHALPGGRLWRRALSQGACLPNAGWEVIEEGLSRIGEVEITKAGNPQPVETG